jgi:hypothetical protein
MDAYFNGVWRMDWGLGNANKTAGLISTLMVGAWGFAYLKKWGFWVALILFIGLGMCLVHTISRGGLLAACSGLALVLWHLPRPWRGLRVGALLAGLGLVIASSVYLGTYSRYSEGITENDPSISNRIALWWASPRMMVDAPAGWGIGNSGKAYMQWYQPLNHHETYRTLVNSHLTWLVEVGWPLRFVYIFAWLSILALTYPSPERPWSAILLGIWIAFFVSSFFSSVAESVWLWAIPIAALSIALYIRWSSRVWMRSSTWLILGGLSALSIVMLVVIGSIEVGARIEATKSGIIIGQSDPKVWVVVDPKIIGTDYGRTLRQYVSDFAVGLTASNRLPLDVKGDILVICGGLKQLDLQKVSSIVPHFRRILFVNPTFYPQEFKIGVPVQTSAIFGEFATSSSINEWKVSLGTQFSILSGAGDYIPNWPSALLGLKKRT